MEYEKGTIAWLLKSYFEQTFIGMLREIPGKKDLIISPDLIQPLDLVCSYSSLKANGVDKIYKLEDGIPPGTTSNRIYLTRADTAKTRIICNHINSNPSVATSNINYFAIFVPKSQSVCEQLFEEEGVYGFITVLSYPLSLIPLDTDLFSCEYPSCFNDLYVNMDQSPLSSVVVFIPQLQSLLGNIGNIYAVGNYSKMALHLHKLLDNKPTQQSNGHVTDLILIDRDIDYAATLLSQVSYEGLLDEVFGIKCGKIVIPADLVKSKELKTSKYNAHSSDVIYRDIRDCHLSVTFSRLRQKMQHLKSKSSERKEMDLAAMKGFVANELKHVQSQHQSFTLHVSVCELIMEKKKEDDFIEQLSVEQYLLSGQNYKECLNHIEEGIIRQLSPELSFRLMCLLSLSQEGVPSKDYKNLVRLALQSYGHEHLITVFNLRKLGLLTEKSSQSIQLSSPTSASSSTSNSVGSGSVTMSGVSSAITGKVAAAISVFPRRSQFRSLVRKLNLMPPSSESGYDLNHPTDPGYVFGGIYIPVVCRIIESLILKKDVQTEDITKLLPIESIRCPNYPQYLGDKHLGEKVVFLFFIGGVTYAEVAAIRFLASANKLKIIIGATSIINGNLFVKQVSPEKSCQ